MGKKTYFATGKLGSVFCRKSTFPQDKDSSRVPARIEERTFERIDPNMRAARARLIWGNAVGQSAGSK
jgi:hypothetical protein